MHLKPSFLAIIARIIGVFRQSDGFGLAEGGDFEILMFKFTIMLNRIPNAQTNDCGSLLGTHVMRSPFFAFVRFYKFFLGSQVCSLFYLVILSMCLLLSKLQFCCQV